MPTTLCHASRPVRKGVILPMVALLIGILLVMVAFAVDIGSIALAKTELQAAADSAALAGCQELMARELLQGATNPNQGATKARDFAVEYAARHTAGGVTLALDRNNSNQADGEIVLGYIANPRISSTLNLNTTPYNSIQVMVRRDKVRNQPLDLFFGKVSGTSTAKLTATATATLDSNIVGFKITSSTPPNARLLPFAFDIQEWNKIFTSGSDNFNWNKDLNLVTPGPDGIREAKTVFPKKEKPGNFGTIDIGSASNGTPDLVRQIQFGPDANDLSYYPNGEFRLNPVTGQMLTEGDTGKSTAIGAALATIYGQPRILPLYSSVSRNGNNSVFTLVAFVGVVVLDSKLTGTSPYVTIQPAFVYAPAGISGNSPGLSRFVYRGITLAR